MEKKTRLAIKELFLLKEHSGHMKLAAEEWKSQWQTLIAIILSARTRDETTIHVAEELFRKYPAAKDLANADIEDIRKVIRPVNFYINKSENIFRCSRRIVDEYRGEVPKNEDELLKLPGVGRKTMNVFLTEMGKDAIGVDTHVSYLSQRLGWTKNSNPEKIEQDLKALFPKEYWGNLNSILVRFGKTHISRKSQDRIIDEIKKEAA